MILTADERKKFYEYLMSDIGSNAQILVQLEKMKMPGTEAIITKRREEMKAEMIVADMLRATQTESIE